MYLYHGTSAKYLDKILKEGLRPRNFTKVSNWDHTVASHPDMVYLTSCYPVYFAQSATKDWQEKLVICRIKKSKLKRSLLRPDEDGLEQMGRKAIYQIKDMDMLHATAWLRDHIDSFKHATDTVLEHLGTCAYKGEISASDIHQIAVIDPRKNHRMWSSWDPTITTVNHMIMGKRYEAMTEWIFGKKITPAEYFGIGYETMPKEFQNQVEAQSEEILADRSGIEIIKGGGK